MEEYLYANAQQVREAAKRMGINAQYDEAGVLWLDGFIDRQREAASDEVKQKLPNTLGSFLGECIRHTYGGQWLQDKETGYWCVKINDMLTAYPFHKVDKQLRSGDGESVYGFFTAIRAMLSDPLVAAGALSATKSNPVKRPWWRL